MSLLKVAEEGLIPNIMIKIRKNEKKILAVLTCACMMFAMSGCAAGTVVSENAVHSEDTESKAGEEAEETEEAEEVEEAEEIQEAEETEESETSEEDEAEAASEGGNIIPGGSFDENNTHWGIYEESGGSGSFSISGGVLKIKIVSPGSKGHSVQIFCDGFELLQGGKYKMSFDVSSDTERTITWRIQVNGGDYHAYVEQSDVAIGPDLQTVECEFVMEEGSDPSPRLCFNIGDADKAQGLGAHEIILDNVCLVLEDSSEALEVDTSTGEVNVNLNQLGFYPEDSKRAVIRDMTKDDSFEVRDASNDNTVFEGKLTESINKGNSGEKVSYADFSDLTAPGEYYVHTENNGDSFKFEIKDNPYRDAFVAACKMLYLQRCGTELKEEYAGDFAHGACHTEKAKLYGGTQMLDVSGGWHDAGDYGRYASAAAKALADIMLAYEKNPTVFTDDTGIAESGNKIPDILDEAKYEIDWLLKMQNSEGGVYHKVTGLNFDGIVMPEDCTEELFVLPPSKTATADFAGVMYMAARIFGDRDSAFAKDCIKRAEMALDYYEQHIGDRNYVNPEDVLTGEYVDGNSSDEYLWALCEGYKTTGDDKLAKKITSFDYDKLPEDEGLGWANMKGYAYYAYLTGDKIANVPYDFEKALIQYADEITNIVLSESYSSSIRDSYPWGSNMTILNNGIWLLMADEISPNEDYREAARYQFDYVCGANTTSYCFLTGYGTLSPQDPHHRPSQSLEKAMPGMVIGGPDSNLEDPFAKSVLSELPYAHRYFDSAQSYSCNEVTIYWNSPYIYLLSYYTK